MKNKLKTSSKVNKGSERLMKTSGRQAGKSIATEVMLLDSRIKELEVFLLSIAKFDSNPAFKSRALALLKASTNEEVQEILNDIKKD